MRGSAKRGLHRLLNAFGIDVAPYVPARFPHVRRLQAIRDRRVSLVLDVGANVGQWASELRTRGYAGRIVSFEPVTDAYAALERRAAKDPLWDCRRLALGEAEATATIAVAANSVSSSLLPIEARHLESAPDSTFEREEVVTVTRLDALRWELFSPVDRLFIKLDVQGFELPALQGGQRTLSQTEALDVELSLVPLYTGQALFPDVVSYLHAAGFDLVALDPGFADPVTGQLLQVDGFFLNRRTADRTQ